VVLVAAPEDEETEAESPQPVSMANRPKDATKGTKARAFIFFFLLQSIYKVIARFVG
jgi:hypothetical protein